MANSPTQPLAAQLKKLPPAEKSALDIGYMRLSDSAPLVVAAAKGLFANWGLEVALHREVSWANIRDKLISGRHDAAQMLSPLPLVTTLGVTGIRAPLITGLVLSLDGNGITLSAPLWEQLTGEGDINFDDATAAAVALRDFNARHGGPPPTFATVHPFSMHSIQLRMWLQSGGIDPDRDARFIVLPPEQMVDSLAQGLITGYCVGEPWNRVAVDNGVGVLVASSHALSPQAPEKVLAVAAEWHQRHPATHLRLRLALMQACQWLGNMANRDEAIELLAQPQYLDLPTRYLRPSLSGQINHARGDEARPAESFHIFSKYDAGFPWRCEAEKILTYCGQQLGRELSNETLRALSQQCFRTDLYREAARILDFNTPKGDRKPAIK